MAHNATSSNNNYTNLNLSALTFLHPPNPPNHLNQCQCQVLPEQQQKKDQANNIRIYYNEPSSYTYNSNCYLIKESRYSSLDGWHAPSDDLVADDAAAGSAVVGVGWWGKSSKGDEGSKGNEGGEEVWETRVYYVGQNGVLRERTNRSFFSATPSEDFEAELPAPEKLVPPTPGWKPTPLCDSSSGSGSKAGSFPTIRPLPATKLAAARCEDESTHVFYQAGDGSIQELVLREGEDTVSEVVVGPGKAKSGSPLAAVEGGWQDLRLFYVGEGDLLKEAYSDDHTKWVESKLPPFTLYPTAMITAVAWNFASSLFQIRVYTTTYTDDLLEISFSRESGGWNNQSSELVSATIPETSSKATTPLSAVAAVRGECNGKIKVYFHPRRKVIAEWDVCDKTPIHAGITKVCEGAKERRRIEEETRRKIKEEEERKRQEAERRRREEEAAKVTVKITDVRVQEKMKKLSGCDQGYAWKKEKGGYRCAGGAHFITDEEFERG